MFVPIYTPISSTPSRGPTKKEVLVSQIMNGTYNLGLFENPGILDDSLSALGFDKTHVRTPDALDLNGWNFYARQSREIADDVQGLSQLVAAHENDGEIDYLFMNDQSKEGSIDRIALNAQYIDKNYLQAANFGHTRYKIAGITGTVGAITGAAAGALFWFAGPAPIEDPDGFDMVVGGVTTMFGGFMGALVGGASGMLLSILIGAGDDRYHQAALTHNAMSNPEDYVYGNAVLGAADREMKLAGVELDHIVARYTTE